MPPTMAATDASTTNGTATKDLHSRSVNWRVLPKGLDEATFDKVCDLVAGVIGEENVSTSHEYGGPEGPHGKKTYEDQYEMRGEGRNTPAGAFRPKSVQELQQIMKIANEYNIPLWVFSRGKNLGYGCTSGVEKGTVMLDLHRMNKIIEVNEEYAYAIVEPGVSFFDLHDYIKERNMKLWISCPALGWGSVLGNTTERGFGYTAMGEHSQQQCGMEVVLPNGEIMRSGMGALEGSDMWGLYKGGFGPSIDGLFFQSSLGVVTKMGIHLQPAPHHFLDCTVSVPEEEDLPVLLSTISRLERSLIIQNHASISNTFRQIMMEGPGKWGTMFEYWASKRAVPYPVIDKIAEELKLGYWKAEFALYGSKAMCEAAWKEVHAAFESVPGVQLNATAFPTKPSGEPARDQTSGESFPDQSSGAPPPLVSSEVGALAIPHAGWPSMDPIKSMDIRGEPGAHTCVAPLFPSNGQQLYSWYLRSKEMIKAAGVDYFSDFHVYGRYIIGIIVIIFGPGQGPRMDRLLKELVDDLRNDGISEYRTHIDYMDEIASHYNFNDGAQRKFIQQIKDVTDPRGILSQGKSGLWNAGHRKTTA